jgi:hypothetical protein
VKAPQGAKTQVERSLTKTTTFACNPAAGDWLLATTFDLNCEIRPSFWVLLHLARGRVCWCWCDDVQLRACATEASRDITRSKQELVFVGAWECISVSSTKVTSCFCSHHVLFDFRLLQVVQYFLAGQKVRLCRRGSLAGPGVVLGYGGGSRLIVLDILRVHVYLIDRTNALYREFLNMHVIDWQMLLSTLSQVIH